MEFSFADIVDNANDVIVVTRARPLQGEGPEIVYVNKAFTELTGYTPEQALGRTPRMLQGPLTEPAARERIRKALEQGRRVRTEISNYTADGRCYVADLHLVPLHDDSGEISHWVAIKRDLTEQKAHERLLFEMAITDSLTGVANRRQLLYRCKEELARARRYGQPLSLLMFDLDHFKQVNDTHGHGAGDAVLKAVAEACRSRLRECDLLARVGGEEFAVVLPETPGQGALVVAERLRRAIEGLAFDLGGSSVGVTASFGVACRQEEDVDPLVILSRADSALYEAKRAGRNRVAA